MASTHLGHGVKGMALVPPLDIPSAIGMGHTPGGYPHGTCHRPCQVEL